MTTHLLPVLDTVAAGYGFVFRRFVTVARVSALSLALIVGASWVFDVYFARDVRATAGGAALAQIASTTVYAALMALAAYEVHRVVLFGNVHRAKPSTRLSFVALAVGAELAYAGLGALLLMGSSEADGWPHSARVLVGTVVLILYGVVWARLALAFPLLVDTGRVDFQKSWQLTRGNWWALIAAWLFSIMPPYFTAAAVLTVASGVFGDGSPESLRPTTSWGIAVGLVLSQAFVLVATALGVAMISTAYKALTGRPVDKPIDVLPAAGTVKT